MRVGRWRVNEDISANLFVGGAFGKPNALELEFATVLESADLKVQTLVGQLLLLERKLSVNSGFTTFL